MAKRLVIDDWRSARRRREVVSTELPERSHPGGDNDIVARVMVAAALRRLSPEHRQVLQLCYLEGITGVEAALRLGIPVGTVKSRAFYAMQAFRLAFEEMGGAA